MPLQRVATKAFERALTIAIEQAQGEWGFAWQYSISKNFRAGGRPRWKPIRADGRTGQILRNTGRLSGSVQVKRTRKGKSVSEVQAFTNNVPYARIHQYGGIIRPRTAQFLTLPLTAEARKKRAKDWGEDLIVHKNDDGGLTLCIKKGDKLEAQYLLAKSVQIPARPFLVVQSEDKKRFEKLILDKVAIATKR